MNPTRRISKPCKVASFFSFAANVEKDSIGEIVDDGFGNSAMECNAMEFLIAVLAFNLPCQNYFSPKASVSKLLPRPLFRG
jgi:hypothetical protein